MRLKERQDACVKRDVKEVSSGRACLEGRSSDKWKETRVLTQAWRQKELIVKVALCIQRIQNVSLLNCDGGLELPKCWLTTFKRIEGKTP